jgi:hypothetical protein
MLSAFRDQDNVRVPEDGKQLAVSDLVLQSVCGDIFLLW